MTTTDGRPVRLLTYNLFNLRPNRGREPDPRVTAFGTVIADARPDVAVVQELRSEHPESSERTLVELAAAAGMTADLTPAWCGEDDAGEATRACAAGGHTFHLGIMWRPETVRPAPESWEAWTGPDFFHAFAMLDFHTVDGRRPFTVGVYHATPFGRGMRGDQAERLAAAVAGRGPRVAIGGDWNTISAARTATGAFYDEDPYAGHPFRPSWIHQCVWTYKPDGTRVHEADRNASERVWKLGAGSACGVGRWVSSR